MATKTAKNIGKTTTLHVHVQHTLLCISSPSLHDYDVKRPNFTYYGERFAKLRYGPLEFNPKKV